MKKFVAEAIGTFAIVFCGTGAMIINQQSNGAITHVGIAITFGLVVITAHTGPMMFEAWVHAKFTRDVPTDRWEILSL